MPGLQPALVFRGLPPQLGLSSDPLPPPRAPHSSSDAPCFWTSVHRFLRPHILCLFTWLRLVPPSCLSCKATSLRKPPLIPDKVRALCYLPRYVSSAALRPCVYILIYNEWPGQGPLLDCQLQEGACFGLTLSRIPIPGSSSAWYKDPQKSTCCLAYDPGHMPTTNDPHSLL